MAGTGEVDASSDRTNRPRAIEGDPAMAAPLRPSTAHRITDRPRRRRIVTATLVAGLALGAAAGCGANPASNTASADQAGGVALPAPAPGPVGNLFEDVGENPWTDPATDAQSTFGLDVDTASYTVARKWIDEGSRPEPDSVRVEEYLNAVVETPPIEGDTALRAEVGGATSPFGGQGEPVHLLRVGVQAETVADEERPDVDLTFVVDVSGSMDEDNRIGLVKQSLTLLTEELRPTDTIAIVAYGSQARVVLEPTAVAERDTIVDAVATLQIEGSTNAEAGLAIGYELARSRLAPGRINRVVLASDGVANVGVADPDGLVKQLRDDADAGIELITLGYGMGNFNDAMMEQLADRGDGFYAYIDTYEEAVRLFRDELTSSLVTVADDSKSQVTFDPATVSGYRLVGYENRAIADDEFLDDTVDAGDVGAGHSVTALYEVHLREGVAPTAPVATVDLRWLDPASGQAASTSVPVTVATVTGAFAETDDTTRVAGLVAGWAEIVGARQAFIERGVGFDVLLTELDAAEADLGQDERFIEFAELARRSSTL
jgi:Ca-activated chloride channel family protein